MEYGWGGIGRVRGGEGVGLAPAVHDSAWHWVGLGWVWLCSFDGRGVRLRNVT